MNNQNASSKTSHDEIQIKIDEFYKKLFTEETGIEAKIDRFDEKLFTEETGIEAKIDRFDEKLFTEETGIEAKIDRFDEKLFTEETGIEAKIDRFDEKLFGENGAESRIDDLDNRLQDTNATLDRTQKSSAELIKKLEELVKEKEQEINNKIKKNNEIYESFNKKIEELLPSALSAGLASSYKAAKDSFKTQILFYTIAVVILYLTFIGLGIYNLWSYAKLSEISLVLIFSKILIQLPFIGLLAWLTSFISSKLNAAIRLQQEYAHKEAVASSYSSFKQQIESIESDKQTELLEKLMEHLINNVSFNPSKTLDKYSTDKNPIESTGEILNSAINNINTSNN